MSDEVPTPPPAPPHQLQYAPVALPQASRALRLVALVCALLLVPVFLAKPEWFSLFRRATWGQIAVLGAVGTVTCLVPALIAAYCLWRARTRHGCGRRYALNLLLLALINVPLGDLLIRYQTDRTMHLHYEGETWIRCNSNLRQIFIACTIYAVTHQDRFPGNLSEAVWEPYDTHMFVCPFSPDVPAPGPTTQDVRDQISLPRHLSYVYVGSGQHLSTANTSTVIAYEHPGNHDSRGLDLWVLYGDGSVRAMSRSALEQLIQSLPPATRPASP